MIQSVVDLADDDRVPHAPNGTAVLSGLNGRNGMRHEHVHVLSLSAEEELQVAIRQKLDDTMRRIAGLVSGGAAEQNPHHLFLRVQAEVDSHNGDIQTLYRTHGASQLYKEKTRHPYNPENDHTISGLMVIGPNLEWIVHETSQGVRRIIMQMARPPTPKPEPEPPPEPPKASLGFFRRFHENMKHTNVVV